MEAEGPPIEIVLRRIADVPQDFLAEPIIGAVGKVAVPAVVHDVGLKSGVRISDAKLQRFQGVDPKQDRSRLSLTLLLCWVLADEWARGAKATEKSLLELLDDTAVQLAQHAAPAKYIEDPDRREELARLSLAALGFRPAGESRAQAQDRLTSISSVERTRVLKASRAAEERARAIREALARKAAQESADKWTRE